MLVLTGGRKMLEVVLLILVFLTSIITTIAGFGTSTIMVPILVLFLPPIEVIIFVALLDFITSLWRTTVFYKNIE